MPWVKLLRVVMQNIARSKKNFIFSSIGIIVGISTFTFFIALSEGVREGVLNRMFPIDQLEVEPVGGVAAGGSAEGDEGGVVNVLGSGPRMLDRAAVEQLKRIEGVTQAFPKMRARFPAKVETGILDRRMAGEGFMEGLQPSETVLREMRGHEERCSSSEEDVCRRREVSCMRDGDCPHAVGTAVHGDETVFVLLRHVLCSKPAVFERGSGAFGIVPIPEEDPRPLGVQHAALAGGRLGAVVPSDDELGIRDALADGVRLRLEVRGREDRQARGGLGLAVHEDELRGTESRAHLAGKLTRCGTAGERDEPQRCGRSQLVAEARQQGEQLGRAVHAGHVVVRRDTQRRRQHRHGMPVTSAPPDRR